MSRTKDLLAFRLKSGSSFDAVIQAPEEP